jgi:hypothetical protein
MLGVIVLDFGFSSDFGIPSMYELSWGWDSGVNRNFTWVSLMPIA